MPMVRAGALACAEAVDVAKGASGAAGVGESLRAEDFGD
ncbi:hypothetical protein QO017_002991 [Methylobacterium gregans]|jgi:hypothetical protein|nr:hypothetical protein [Methylobacterium gregans]